MVKKNKYKSSLLKCVEDFLAGLSSTLIDKSDVDTWKEIDLAARSLGFGEPFDSEQRQINKMLLQKRANYIVCKVVWQHYYNCKLYNAAHPEAALD